MGCGCGKKARLPTSGDQRWAAVVDKPYRNGTDQTLISRNPRFEVKPGETTTIDVNMINSSVRLWIRSGSLVPA